MIPKKIYLNYVEEEDFDNGAEITWCIDPVSVAGCEMRNREYTDLSQVWHPANEKPEENKQIIAINVLYAVFGGYYNTHKNILMLQSNCLYMGFDAIIRWAYVDDLLPKGGSL